MTYTEAVNLIQELAGVIRDSRMGPITQEFVLGLLEVVLYYLPQAFILFPSEVKE